MIAARPRSRDFQLVALRKGFTLIELLVVMAIAAILFGLAAQVTVKTVQASNIATELDTLTNELSRASLEAVRRNRPIHFRLYRGPDPIDGTPRILAYQTVVLDTDELAYVTSSPLRELSDGFVIFDDDQITTLLNLPERTPVQLPRPNPEDVIDPPLPDVGGGNDYSYTYYEFQFRPDGSTNLPKDESWGLVLTHVSDAFSGTPSPGYRSLTINAFTGAVKKY